MPSYARQTDTLDQYLQDNEGDDDLDEILDLEFRDVIPNRNVQRKREIFDEIVVQRTLPSQFRGRNL